jgi:hypothetical protein
MWPFKTFSGLITEKVYCPNEHKTLQLKTFKLTCGEIFTGDGNWILKEKIKSADKEIVIAFKMISWSSFIVHQTCVRLSPAMITNT